MISNEYVRAIIEKFKKTYNKLIKKDYELQGIYDNCDDYYELLNYLQEYNLKNPTLYLASGLSCYFNDQVDQNGLKSLKLREDDKEDARFIASCFGRKIHYSDNDLSIIYTSLFGTVEFKYGMQTFPAGIFEDVFGCDINHSFPISPKVGETEVDFYQRIMEYQISKSSIFPLEKKSEVMYRAKRLTEHFISGDNRIYIIPFDNVLENKSSFGDVRGLRDGLLSGDELKRIIGNQFSFKELLEHSSVSFNMYKDPNFVDELGIAIYGEFDNKGVKYFEIERIFDLMQRRARQLGLLDGEEIPADLDVYNPASRSHLR